MRAFLEKMKNNKLLLDLLSAMSDYILLFLPLGFFWYSFCSLLSSLGAPSVIENVDFVVLGTFLIIFLELVILATFRFWKVCKAVFLFFKSK